MHDLGAWLASQKASANTDFALGPERFSKMLSTTEGVDIPLDQLEAIGKADLAKNQAALKQACAQFAPGATIVACTAKMKANKPPEGPVAAARQQIPELRAFVVSHDIVSIPGTEEAKAEESPAYHLQHSAYTYPPGPIDKGIQNRKQPR